MNVAVETAKAAIGGFGKEKFTADGQRPGMGRRRKERRDGRRGEKESEDADDFSMMDMEKNRGNDEMMVRMVKETEAGFNKGIKRVIYTLISKPSFRVNQCFTNPSVHLEFPQSRLG